MRGYIILVWMISCFGLTSSSELIINGDFEQRDFGWQMDCLDNPLQHDSLHGYYLVMTPPCQIKQCMLQSGYLKMQVSSLDINITFDDLPFYGDVVYNHYGGFVTCRNHDGCCLGITVNSNSTIDNISLDDSVKQEKSHHDGISQDVKIVIIIFALLVFCICGCVCCHHLIKNRIDNPDSEMHEVVKV